MNSIETDAFVNVIQLMGLLYFVYKNEQIKISIKNKKGTLVSD